MNTSPFLTLNRSCDEALRLTKEKLLVAGLRPVQTFDLHTARSGLQDCPCPHHGTDECDCQLVVLLVYGDKSEPVTLILHGNDGQTWLSLASDSAQHFDNSVRSTIEHILNLDQTQ